MRVELIGNGLNGTLKTTEYYLRKSFMDSEFENFIGFSAYTKKNGLNLFLRELLEAKKRFKSVKFYLGIAEKGTSKEVLEFLLEQKIETWTFCSYTNYIFHPKIYFFEGDKERRIIIGSSNLTKKGLSFDGNIEASVLIDYAASDTGGLKLQRQYFEYFDEIINATNNCVNLLTRELLDEFVEKGYVVNELKTFEDGHSGSHSGSRTNKPKREKIVKKVEKLEKLDKQSKSEEKESKSIGFTVTDRYLNAWDSMFEAFLKFKKDKGTVTVPRDCEIPGLSRWYRMQKIFYADKSIDSIYDLKDEHIKRLEDVGFYFGDANKLLQQNKEDEWMDIVTEAIADPKERKKIGVNHRYRFNGNRLGTWLVALAQEIRKENPKKRKLELYNKIKELGFDINKHTKDPKNSSQRFVDKLLNDKSPVKVEYQNIFNHIILPKSDKLTSKIKEEIDIAWELQFKEKRSWEKTSRSKDRTQEWKEFRYNSLVNPDGKWSLPSNIIGNLWHWIHKKRVYKSQMEQIKLNFNETELEELRLEGFPI